MSVLHFWAIQVFSHVTSGFLEEQKITLGIYFSGWTAHDKNICFHFSFVNREGCVPRGK